MADQKEKSEDISTNMGRTMLNVTPPPSYDEAVGGNLPNTGQPHSSHALPSYNPQPVPRSYPVQDSGGVAVQPKRPIVPRPYPVQDSGGLAVPPQRQYATHVLCIMEHVENKFSFIRSTSEGKHTHTHTDEWLKTFFLDSGDLKTDISGENTISKI